MFFVLRGRVFFHVDGTTVEACTGDSVVRAEGACTSSRTPVRIASTCSPS